MVRLPNSVNTLAHDVSSNVASLAHDLSSNVSSLAQDVAPKVSSLAQDVAARAQDAAQVAGKHGRRWGGKAVTYGRENLEHAGVIAKPKQSHRGRNALVIVLAVVGGAVIFKLLFGRSDHEWQSAGHDIPSQSSTAPEAERLADRNHVDTA